MGTPSGGSGEGGGVPCRAVWTEAVLGIGVGDAIHWASFHAGINLETGSPLREAGCAHGAVFPLDEPISPVGSWGGDSSRAVF